MTPGLDLRLAGFRGDNFYPGGVDASPVLDGHEGSQSLRDPAVPSETKWDRGRIYMNLLQFGVFFFCIPNFDVLHCITDNIPSGNYEHSY